MNKEYKPINNLWKDSEGYRYFGTLKLSSKIKYDGDDFIPLWEWVNQLQQENEQLKEIIKENTILVKDEYGDYQECNINPLGMKQKYDKQLDNWNKLREYFNERIEVCDNRLSSPFCNFEKATKERLIFSQCLEKLEELEGSDSNGQ